MTSRVSDHTVRCSFLPPWLLERAGLDHALDDELRARRERLAQELPTELPTAAPSPAVTPVAWTVHDAELTVRLPGRPVRGPGDPDTGDPAVDEAASGIVATLAMWAEGLGRPSFDAVGGAVDLVVHYGRDYVNAFWDGEHLVFGDGDGDLFERFTKPVDVLAHEFGHAVVDHTARLVYRDQPGALNESVCDAFASCLKQRLLGQDAASGDWLIGEGLFTSRVAARALRDMAAPGTAYDDPRLGADPQVGHLDDYVVTTADNGGVHLNSGIPNRAFHLAATGIGGDALEGAGRIWYAALTAASVGPRTGFAEFAAATVAEAGEHAGLVREAWAAVGVAAEPATEPAAGSVGVVRVRRSGGFVGRTTSGEAALGVDDPAVAHVRRLSVSGTAGPVLGRAVADGFVYEFQVDDEAPVRVDEQELTDDLRDLAGRVLRDGESF